MHSRLSLDVAMASVWLLAGGVWSVRADEPKTPEAPPSVSPVANLAPEKTQHVVERALAFLEKDVAKWRKDRGCATCHHGTMTIWALSEAKRQGYAVNAESLAEITQWTKDRFVPRINKPRDPREGWNLVSMPAIYLGVMSQSLPILARDEINQVAVHLARHQEEDGAWLMPPPSNGAPPTWESRETIALLALLAWEPFVPADPQAADAARAAREKAVAWLDKTKPTQTTQATALRLLLDVRTGKPPEQLQPAIDELLKRQNTDGGWSQVQDLPSDAYATGQVLYVLSCAGIKNDLPPIARAVAFLVVSQREDGSWPMTSRNHPGVKSTRNPLRNPVPITYFGSTWGTLGLVRSVPPALDAAVNRQRALDLIRTLSGTYEVDEKSPDQAVVSVKIVYEVDDDDLGKLTKLLTALPRLQTLQLKSARLTDAGLAHLQGLSQLRSLALENAPITDAGLAHLKALTALEALNLKGTKVTASGVEDFQRALPKAQVER